MRISEAAAQCGLSIDTIRYYEKAGLCPPVARGADGRRSFTPGTVDWLILLASLRETGMPNVEMRHFAGLYRQGDGTVAERKAVLRGHAERLAAQEDRLAACRALLDRKLARYDKIMGETS